MPPVLVFLALFAMLFGDPTDPPKPKRRIPWKAILLTGAFLAWLAGQVAVVYLTARLQRPPAPAPPAPAALSSL